MTYNSFDYTHDDFLKSWDYNQWFLYSYPGEGVNADLDSLRGILFITIPLILNFKGPEQIWYIYLCVILCGIRAFHTHTNTHTPRSEENNIWEYLNGFSKLFKRNYLRYLQVI